ncbi:MAG TPA: hypothetical protein VI603_01615 [Saprospiraceae bacterium]|nr:hypothetical protein [Saprospiraceae bacterium]
MQAANNFICNLTLIALIAIISGCDIINPADPVPAYIQVDQITVEPVSGTGTTRQKFGEVWVYFNDNFVGAYSVPAVIPLIASGQVELMLFPGIRVNGIQSTADFYPFFEPYTISATLIPGETLTIDMHTRYRSNAIIAYIEDFESSHRLTDDLDDDPATFVERIADGAFEGNGSGRIVLTNDADFIQVASVPVLTDLPVNGTPVYLELHYKNNVEFSIGLVGHGQGIEPASVSILVLRPQEDWNKVYVELTPAFRASQLDGYQVLYTAAHDSALERSEIFLDNMKLVHIAQ